MTPRFHLPGEIRFRGVTDGLDRAAVAAAIRAGIARGLAGTAGGADGGGEVGQEDLALPEHLGEPFDPSRHRAERGAYTVPSYDANGAPVELPLAEPFAVERAPDLLFTSPSPLEGRRLAVFPLAPRGTDVHVRSERYAVVPNLARALGWGNLVFGGRSFGVLEGPGGFWVVATQPTLSRASLRSSQTSAAPGRPGGIGAAGRTHWEPVVRDGGGNVYRLRTLVTVEGDPLVPPGRGGVEELLSEVAGVPRRDAAIPRAEARSFLFSEIDRRLAAAEPEAAAPQLAELDANAFTLLDWETRMLYLEALLAVRIGEEEKAALFEILKSACSREELDAALALLHETGRFDDLFEDPGDLDDFDALEDRLWTLLVLLGERFGPPDPLRFGRLVELLQEAGLLERAGSLLAAVAGAGILGLSADVLLRVRERLLAEITALVVGDGEIQANGALGCLLRDLSDALRDEWPPLE